MSFIKIQLIEIYLRWIWRIPTSPSEGKVLTSSFREDKKKNLFQILESESETDYN